MKLMNWNLFSDSPRMHESDNQRNVQLQTLSLLAWQTRQVHESIFARTGDQPVRVLFLRTWHRLRAVWRRPGHLKIPSPVRSGRCTVANKQCLNIIFYSLLTFSQARYQQWIIHSVSFFHSFRKIIHFHRFQAVV